MYFQIQLYKKKKIWKKLPTTCFPTRTFCHNLTILKMKHKNFTHCGATSEKSWI